MTSSQHTALHAEHEKLGAVFTDFGGWDMPLRYANELNEHRAVREAAGLFDLSHMGEVRVTGPDAARFLNTALVGNLAAIALGKAKYSLICNEQGGIIDDLIVYRLAENEFFVVPNASNAPAVVEQFQRIAENFDVSVTDETHSTSLIAVQGPRSVAVLANLVPIEQQETLLNMPYYAAAEVTVAGLHTLAARTGYTGEDGFELFVPNAHAVELWSALLTAGQANGLVPAGLASRDSLRLEAGMPLYGNELSLQVSPFEAGLGAVVSFKKPEDFVGRQALEQAKDQPLARQLVGLTSDGRRAGRAGYTVHAEGREIGSITSGVPSPSLGTPIALAYVEPAFAVVGTEVQVDLRGKLEPFTVAKLPFYKRQQKVSSLRSS